MMTAEEAKFWFENARQLVRLKANATKVESIKQSTKMLPHDSSITQRLFHIIHTLNAVPDCKMQCGSTVSWDKRYKHYKTYCSSSSCSNSDPVIKEKKLANTDTIVALAKRKQTNLVKYGHTNYLASERKRQVDKSKNLNRVVEGSPTRISPEAIESIIKQYEDVGKLDHANLELLFNGLKSLAKGKTQQHTRVREIITLITNGLPETEKKANIWLLLNNLTQPPMCITCLTNRARWNPAAHTYNRFCSPACSGRNDATRLKTRHTNLAKYGVVSYSQTPEWAEQTKASWRDRDVDEVRQIVKMRSNTMRQLYGVVGDEGMNNIAAKKQRTSLANWGETHPMKSPKVRAKVAETLTNRTPDEVRRMVQNREQTCVDTFGSRNPSQSHSIKEKKKQTLMTNYGVDNPNYIDTDPESYTKLRTKEWMYDEHVTKKLTLQAISKELGIGDTTVGRYLRSHGIETKHHSVSMGHKEVSEFLMELGVEHTTNDRSQISPLELDIFIPSHNIAIEYCGLYWHSEQKGKTRQYHKTKHDKCKEIGVQLITMFEDEWINSKDQVKNKIRSLLGLVADTAVYARTTTVVDVEKRDSRSFLEANHLQGDGPGSIRHGLIDNAGKLVAVMVWIAQPNNQYTLNRYATSTRVVGGFTKLLAHFKKSTPGWKTIVSFADLRWSNGNMYSKTGWVLDSTLAPDYYYSPNGVDRYHKFNYRRANLPKLLDYFDPVLSEWENCRANNVLRLWDCGKMRFVQHCTTA